MSMNLRADNLMSQCYHEAMKSGSGWQHSGCTRSEEQ